MKSTLSFFVAGAALLALSCGSIPEVQYYMVDLSSQAEEGGGNQKGLPVTLGISPLTAPPVYQDDRIIYRNNPYEVNFYHYRRWVASPPELVTEELYQHFVASGAFEEVVRYIGSGQVDYVLGGEVLAFEEWDENDTWYAQVGLRVRLTSTSTGDVIWQDTVFRRQAAKDREPVRVVEAMSQALEEVVAELLGKTQAVITRVASTETSPSN